MTRLANSHEHPRDELDGEECDANVQRGNVTRVFSRRSSDRSGEPANCSLLQGLVHFISFCCVAFLLLFAHRMDDGPNWTGQLVKTWFSAASPARGDRQRSLRCVCAAQRERKKEKKETRNLLVDSLRAS